jgi:Protein of unknown function (DUF2911)
MFRRNRFDGGIHVRALAVCILLLGQFVFNSRSLAQQNDSDQNSATAFCDFEDGQEISVRYSTVPVSSKDEPHNGRIWIPGGKPMTLFTGATVALNNTTIPAGAYTLYFIPNKKEWTLIVNKNVTAGAAYDEHQDVARGQMDLGEVDSPPKQVQVSFAHTGPKVCSIRIYYGKVGAFTEFNEK